jgi:ribosome-associated translation inhibitor RaiA
MQTPLEIEFKDMPTSAALEQLIRDKVAKLEQLHDRITSCRVTVLEPHRHNHQGKQFHVHIRLAVPGNVLVTSHDSGDKGHEDANVAVRDAFTAIRRQLENHVQLQRGDVKEHSRSAAEPQE